MNFKINISELGAGPHPVNDTTNYLIQLFKTIDLHVVHSKDKPIDDGINIVHEGFNFKNVKLLDKYLKKNFFLLFKTELFVINNKFNLQDATFNDWKLNKRILSGNQSKIYIFIQTLIYNFKKTLLRIYLGLLTKYHALDKLLKIKTKNKKSVKLYKLILILFSQKFSRILIYIFFKSKFSDVIYFIIKSPHEIDHSRTSFLYEFFRKNIHWKDLCQNTYTRLNYFKGVLGIALDENVKKICDRRNIEYINLPYIYLGTRQNISFNSKKNFSHDLLFTGLSNDYRQNFLSKINKKFDLKIYDFIHSEVIRKKVNQSSRLIISLKKNKEQSIVSLGRFISSMNYETPIIFEMDEYMVPKYILPYIETFDANNYEKRFRDILDNYDKFCLEYTNKINSFIKYSQKEKQLFKEKIYNLYQKLN